MYMNHDIISSLLRRNSSALRFINTSKVSTAFMGMRGCWLGVLLHATILIHIARPTSVRAQDLSSSFYLFPSPPLGQFLDDNQEIELVLTETDGSGFASYNNYLFGVFSMRIKMIAGESAGTVTAFYMSSLGGSHDELDFEFLGNVSGEPINLQTNLYANGVGSREQRINLWFDPTADFHTYTFFWNAWQAVFYVDGVPIRVYPNIEAQTGVSYLTGQPMFAYGSIWDGDTWATEFGRIKIDWDYAPFVAYYTDFSADGCASPDATLTCAATKWWNQQNYASLDTSLQGQLNWVRQNYLIYDYCNDRTRYAVPPTECAYLWPAAKPQPINTSILTPSNSSTVSKPSSSVLSSVPTSAPTTSPHSSAFSPSEFYHQPLLLTMVLASPLAFYLST